MKIKNNQSGLASMVIVILIMTLLTLIVISMTQNSNREQRQALDRQLNSQALYAAESGIADAKDYIAKNTDAPKKKTKCDNTEIPGATVGQQFKDKNPQVGDAELGAVYSCVLYDREPESLVFDNVDTGSPVIMPIEDAGGLTIRSLTFNWKKKGSGTGPTSGGQTNVHTYGGCQGSGQTEVLLRNWPSTGCDAGMLRVELINPAPTDRDTFLDRTFLAYFKPTPNEPTPTIQYSQAATLDRQGALVNGKCDENGECTATITNVNSTKLYLSLRSLYIPNELTSIKGVAEIADGTTRPVKFREAQVSVDSTGRAADILKRISVRVPLSGLQGSLITPFVLQTSDDLCKQLRLRPGQPTAVINDC